MLADGSPRDTIVRDRDKQTKTNIGRHDKWIDDTYRARPDAPTFHF